MDCGVFSFTFFFTKLGRRICLKSEGIRAQTKDSTILPLILFDVKTPSFFLCSATKSCSEGGINHYTIKGNETLIYGPLDAFFTTELPVFWSTSAYTERFVTNMKKSPQRSRFSVEKMLLGSFRRTKHWRQSCPETWASSRNSAFWFLPRASQLKNLTSVFSIVNGRYVNGFSILPSYSLICTITGASHGLHYSEWVVEGTRSSITCRHQVSWSKLILSFKSLEISGCTALNLLFLDVDHLLSMCMLSIPAGLCVFYTWSTHS